MRERERNPGDTRALAVGCAWIVERMWDEDFTNYRGALLYLAAYFHFTHDRAPTTQANHQQLPAEVAALQAQLHAALGATPVGAGGRGRRGKPRLRFHTEAEQRAYDLGYATGWHRGKRETRPPAAE